MYFRLLSPHDYTECVKLLNQFRETKLKREDYSRIFYSIREVCNIWVLIDDSKNMVAIATLLIENKLIHNGSKVAHIEDVVVDKNFLGKGYGKKMIEFLTEKAKNQGCYKVILNCDEEVVGFYEKCGFTQKSLMMEFRF